jgi:cell division protease FtsH
MTKQTRFHIGYWIIAILGLMALQYFYVTAQRVALIPYSQFQQLLHDGKVAEVGVSDRYIQGRLKEPLPDGKSQFITTRVDPQFADELQKYGVTYTGQVESTFLQDLLSWIVPVVVFLGLWMLLARRMSQGLGGGLMSIGKSKAKIYVEADTGVRFDDVAGVDEAKDELREIVEFLKNPAQYGRLGGRAAGGAARYREDPAREGGGRRGKSAVLLDFRLRVRRDVRGRGRGARARPVRAGARTHAPAIIFIDELDALGRARGIGPYAGGHDEKEQTLNQLLTEMDGFDSRAGLVILAATNRPEILDPALLRAGRAYHEMGHAIVALSLPGTDPVHKVSIIPRGVGALGYTIQRPTEDRFLMTREELDSKMSVRRIHGVRGSAGYRHRLRRPEFCGDDRRIGKGRANRKYSLCRQSWRGEPCWCD